MKSVRKMWILGVVAAAAILAVPAAASASIWTQEGAPLEADHSIELDGNLTFTSSWGWGGAQCNVHMDATLSPQGAGAVDSAQIENCQSFGSFKTALGCNWTYVDSETPWTLTPAPTQATVGGVSMEIGMNSGCLVGTQMWGGGSFTLTPDNVEEFSAFTAGGSIETSLGAHKVSGVLAVTPAGAYGME